MVQSWLIKHSYTKVFLIAIWFWHLEECINLSNSRDIVWNERFYLCLKVNFLWFVPVYVLKDLLNILRNG